MVRSKAREQGRGQREGLEFVQKHGAWEFEAREGSQLSLAGAAGMVKCTCYHFNHHTVYNR